MFSVGDKVVYPMYGAGVIEDLEEKSIDGKNLKYYVMKIPVGNLKIMVSANNAEMLGIREIFESDKVMDIVNNALPIAMPENWNQRYKENLERIKTGDLEKVVQVFKTLIFREREKSLSSAEKKMLGTAKQIILSEIIMSQNVQKEQAEEILAKTTMITVV